MSTTIATTSTAPAATATGPAGRTRTSRALPLAALVAGVAGFAGPTFLWQWVEGSVKAAGPQAVVDLLESSRVAMHVGTSLMWLGLAALIAFGVQYVRWLADRVGEHDPLVQTVRLGFTAATGAMILTTGFRSLVVGGLPGAIDSAMYDVQDVSTLHILTDQAQWVGWMGVVVAMAATALLVLRRRVALSRWYGIFTAALTTLVAGMTLVLGLPYSAGLAAPIWLVVSGVVLLRRRDA